MKLHIGLSSKMAQSVLTMPEEQAGQVLAGALGLEQVDTKRLRRFGIVTVEGRRADATRIRSLDGVEWVEPDQKRSI